MSNTTHPRRRGGGARDLLLLLLSSVLLLWPDPAAAIKLELSRNTFLDLHLLLQPAWQLRQDVQADPAFQNDFFLRRTRLLCGGEVTRWISFFVETDQPNWGKGGDWTPDFFVQDAFINVNLHEALIIDGGMLLIPFVHQARQGAGTLHTLDYHSELIRYPKGSNKVWRDSGVQLRGLVLQQRVNYYLAVTEGVGDAAGDAPRVSGRLAGHLFEAENGFFLAGTYLGNKRVLSLGTAFDVQPGAFGPGTLYLGLGADVFLDLPLRRGRRVSGQLDLVYYGGTGNPQAGVGLLFDLGYAFGPLEPVIALDWFRPESAAELAGQLLGIHAGLNWWAMGHTANLKADAGFIKVPGRLLWESSFVFTLQGQLYL